MKHPSEPDTAQSVTGTTDSLNYGRFVCVAAWGSSPFATNERIVRMAELLPGPLHCLGKTKDGAPRHTSRIAYSTPLEGWKGYP
jgi:hypothetical protein